VASEVACSIGCCPSLQHLQRLSVFEPSSPREPLETQRGPTLPRRMGTPRTLSPTSTQYSPPF
jgi:hypothetical protein